MTISRTTVRSYRYYTEILEWLQTNVGDILWSHPLIAWHGNGWHIKQITDVAPRGSIRPASYLVEFDDEKKATMFALWT